MHPRLTEFLARPLVRFIVGTMFIIVPMILLKWVLRPLKLSDSSAATLSAWLGALVALLGYVAYVHWIERRAVSELSGKSAGPELIGGLAIGVLLFAVTIGMLTLLGAFQVVGRGPAALMIAPFAAAVSAGVVEELL